MRYFCFGILAALSSLFSGSTSSAPSPRPITIDHATFCGAELEPMEKAFADAGLKTDYGGPHAGGETHMALLGFEDGSYLELIAPQKPKAPVPQRGSAWGKLMAGDAGPCAWATPTMEIEREVQRLKTLKIPVSTPEEGSRTKPDGMVIRWETASVGKGARGATFPFLIEDLTQRTLRVQPTAGTSGSGLTGIELVVLGVQRLDRTIALFQQSYAWDAPSVKTDPAFGARLAYFACAPVVLAAPISRKGSWLSARLARFGESPVALFFGTNNLDAAKKKFSLIGETSWFGKRAAWFGPDKLYGAKIGVIEK